MAGEKLVQKALRAATENRPKRYVADPLERDINLGKFLQGTKTINDEGDLFKLYHITKGDFSEFTPGGTNQNLSGPAIWLSANPNHLPATHNVGYPGEYATGTNVMPLWASMKNPLMVEKGYTDQRYGSGFPFAISPEGREKLIADGYDSVINRLNPVGHEEYIVLHPEQLKSATGNAGTFDPVSPRIDENRGGSVDAALHAVRHHLAGGGFLSGPDYLSTGEVASPTNWGDPELASDFFKADRAARLAREVLAKESARDIPVPPRRPPPVSEEAVAAAPALVRATLRVKDEEPAPVLPVDEKFTARAMSGPELTERDRDLIIRTIAAETSGKSPEEAQAIAHVILNRIQSGKFGASPEAVLFAKNQFEPWSNPQGSNYPMRFAPTSARYGMGKTALEAALGGDDITRGALNFWGPKAQSALGRKPPPWAAKMPDYFDLGETRFHRPRAEGGEAEGYDKGGKAVSKALKAVSELFDSPGMTKWREKSVIPASSMEDRYFTGTSKDKDFANFNVGRHGAWFTKDPAEASSYALQNDSKGYRRDGWDMVPVNTADRVIPAFLRAENPYRGPLPEMVHAENYKKAQSDWFDTLRAQGHDAWMPENSPNLAVILKNPSDIKSALSNSGDFDLAAPRIDRAEGGEVDAALHMVRHHYATDGYVNTAKRMRDVIASIDPEAGQLAIRNQDVEIPEAYRKDPELAGRMWANAVQAYRNREEGSPELRAITPSLRDEIGGMIAGEGGGRNYASTLRNRAADLLVGSKGLPDSGTLGFGVADAPMLTGIPLTLADMARDVGQGDYGTAAASAALPAALYARGPLGAAGRRAVEIAREYAKPAAATAAGLAGLTAAPDEAEAAKLSKLLQIVSPENRLMMVHNLKSHRLADIEKLGGLPVPSTAVIKPAQGFTNFGDITMVAPKEMAQPSRTNPIFAADVYSPRFPSTNDEGTKIFKGFTHSGTRRYSPLTLENAVKEMKGNIRGGEGFNYGAGTIRSGVAPQFKSIEQIQNARDLIKPREEMTGAFDLANEKLNALAEKYYPHYGYGGDQWTHMKDFSDMLREAGMGKWGELRKTYKSSLPPELHGETVDFLNYLKQLPTEYFEGKPQRAVRLDEFRGAVVPGDITGEQADILRRMGVSRLEQYDPNNPASRIEALQKFGEEQFASGGLVNQALDILRKV